MLRRSFVSFCVILFSVLGQLSADKYGYEYIPEAEGWLRLYTVPATWEDAQQRCKFEGGSLASPTSSALASAMMKMMGDKEPTSNKVYTGINAIIAKGDYTTIEGVPISNISLGWAAGEPDNNQNSEDCLVMNGNGELADVSCSRVFRYFCYKESAKMSATKCGTWDSDYKLEPRTGSCYKFHTVPLDWHRAALACRAEQAYLAVINSDMEAQVLKELFDKHPPHTINNKIRDYVLIGFWDQKQHGEWRTIFGQTLAEAGFGGWSENQPDNYNNNEYCGTMHRNGRLNDFTCDAKAVFLCEILS